MNKRGLSGVIIALIMILLAIVVSGVLWVVIRGTVETGTAQIGTGAKCLEVEVRPTIANCDASADTCDVTLTRTSTGDDIAGVKIILTSSDGTSSHVADRTGNIAKLATVTQTAIDHSSSFTTENVSEVEVAIYFLDGSGNEEQCAISGSFTDVVTAA